MRYVPFATLFLYFLINAEHASAQIKVIPRENQPIENQLLVVSTLTMFMLTNEDERECAVINNTLRYTMAEKPRFLHHIDAVSTLDCEMRRAK